MPGAVKAAFGAVTAVTRGRDPVRAVTSAVIGAVTDVIKGVVPRAGRDRRRDRRDLGLCPSSDRDRSRGPRPRDCRVRRRD